MYSGPGAASALIHRRRPHPQRDDGSGSRARNLLENPSQMLTVGFPIACYSECHSERNSKVSASHLKKPAAGRDLPLTDAGFPRCLLSVSCPMHRSTSCSPSLPGTVAGAVQNLPCQITRGHSDTSSHVSISGGHTREKLREIKCTPSKKPGNATSFKRRGYNWSIVGP